MGAVIAPVAGSVAVPAWASTVSSPQAGDSAGQEAWCWIGTVRQRERSSSAGAAGRCVAREAAGSGADRAGREAA